MFFGTYAKIIKPSAAGTHPVKIHKIQTDEKENIKEQEGKERENGLSELRLDIRNTFNSRNVVYWRNPPIRLKLHGSAIYHKHVAVRTTRCRPPKVYVTNQVFRYSYPAPGNLASVRRGGGRPTLCLPLNTVDNKK